MGKKTNNIPLKKQAKKLSGKQRNMIAMDAAVRSEKRDKKIRAEAAIWEKIDKEKWSEPALARSSEAKRALALVPVQVVPKQRGESNRKAKQRLREMILAD